MKNPFEDRDLGAQLRWPTLSWSSLNAFESYDKNKWYQQYVLGIRSASNANMDAGREIGERLATDPTYLPEVKRYDVMEQELRGQLGKINLVGHIDTFDTKTKSFGEYKTSVSKTRWTQKTSEDHGQLLFYFLLIYLNFQVKPEDIKCHLFYIPVRETGHFAVELSGKKVQCFEIKKTLKDVLVFGVRIKKTYAEMLAFVEEKSKIK